jgi:hypothetical protein
MPFQRHEDAGRAQLYVDAEPYETTPGPTEEEKREAASKLIRKHADEGRRA